MKAEYTWAEDAWGDKDSVTGQWDGLIGQVHKHSSEVEYELVMGTSSEIYSHKRRYVDHKG